ncbi:hypothetical protein R1sor_006587 [Riccia sorocarpa]|uniref:Uncharacterized protein n=1 Tax=Riccia sorocarpa TaxID=122646 RepID=A0ABD3HS43_9MARC
MDYLAKAKIYSRVNYEERPFRCRWLIFFFLVHSNYGTVTITMRIVLRLLIGTRPHEDPHRDAFRRGSSSGRVPMRIFMGTPIQEYRLLDDGSESYKEVIHLVCCSDETYAAFEKFVKRWKERKIHDVHGTIGPSKDPRTGLVCDRDVSQLSVNRFRPINGLSDEDLKLAWTVLEEVKVWVMKPARYQWPEDVVSLKDFCKVLKATRDLEKRILKYWNTR